jgi:putative redox protein
MTTRMVVRHEDGDRFEVLVRGHRLVIDQPVMDGGTDAGPTPTELFVAGLASCVGFYAERFLRRHGLPSEGLRVDSTFAFAEDRPARVASITLGVHVPGLPASRREALLAVIEHCTVHNSIRTAPCVRIELDPDDLAA